MELEPRDAERGGRLHYGVAGTGDPVVLLHGWPESGRAWRDVWPALVEAGRRVIVPDLRGVGGSDRSPGADYSWRGYAGDLDSVLAAESIDRCAIVGHDMGGVVMFEWALRNPGRVERLVAISTSFNRYELAKSYYLLILVAPGIGGLFMRAATGSRAAFARALRRNAVHPEVFSDDDVDAYYAAAGSPESRRAILAGYKAFFRNRRTRERDVGTVRLECPALIIWGTKEWALGDDGWKRIQADLPHADVQILDAGHFVMEEQPDVVAKLLEDLLAP
jgi:pimeloyl-ACP methyl ester carboxylesterase